MNTTSKDDVVNGKTMSNINVWDFFSRLREEVGEKVAECKICFGEYNYLSTTGNLKYHLRKKHHDKMLELLKPQSEPDEDQKNRDEEEPVEENDDDDGVPADDGGPPLERERRKSSYAWKYFREAPGREKTAECTLCGGLYSYKSTAGNLNTHLRKKHQVIFPESTPYSEEEEEQEEGEDQQGRRKRRATEDDDFGPPTKDGKVYTRVEDTKKRRHTSALWRFFHRMEAAAGGDGDGGAGGADKVAECRICFGMYNYRSTTGNLKNHLKAKHPEQYLQLAESDYNKPKRNFPARRYFEQLESTGGDKSTRCKVCDGVFSYHTTGNLKRHLHSKHPELVPDDDDEDLETSLEGSSESFQVWKHFDHLQARGDSLQAECALCHEVNTFEAPFTSNLRQHLESAHADKLEEIFEKQNNDSDDELSAKAQVGKRDRRSDVWNYFTGGGGRARCRLCRADFVATTTSNLWKHLRQKHSNQIVEEHHDDDDDEGDAEPADKVEEVIVDPDDPLWKVFNARGATCACALCGDRVPCARADMRAHMLAHHPKVAGIEVEYNSDASEASVRNPLADVDDRELIQRLRASPPRRARVLRPERRGSKIGSVPKPQVDASSTKTQEDEVSSFTTYVGALLRGLPQETSSQLQLDILQLVMSSKIEHEKKKKGLVQEAKQHPPDNTPMYVITLPSSHPLTPNEDVVKEFLIKKQVPATEEKVVREFLITKEGKTSIVIDKVVRTHRDGVENEFDVSQEMVGQEVVIEQ